MQFLYYMCWKLPDVNPGCDCYLYISDLAVLTHQRYFSTYHPTTGGTQQRLAAMVSRAV